MKTQIASALFFALLAALALLDGRAFAGAVLGVVALFTFGAGFVSTRSKE